MQNLCTYCDNLNLLKFVFLQFLHSFALSIVISHSYFRRHVYRCAISCYETGESLIEIYLTWSYLAAQYYCLEVKKFAKFCFWKWSRFCAKKYYSHFQFNFHFGRAWWQFFEKCFVKYMCYYDYCLGGTNKFYVYKRNIKIQ